MFLKEVLKHENFEMETVTKLDVALLLGVPCTDFYLLKNGKVIYEYDARETNVQIIPTVLGGKGGFGSMLRAIGAQIEKTTNREACRDLSGRRLRDINEEKRLKKWINQQAEREQLAEDRRQKKLERLCKKPTHEFKDEEYDKRRSELPEKVEDALEQGLKATGGQQKRKGPEVKGKSKKTKLWLDSDEEELSSSLESEDEIRKESETSNEAGCSKDETKDITEVESKNTISTSNDTEKNK